MDLFALGRGRVLALGRFEAPDPVIHERAHAEQLLATGYGGGRCWLSDPAWMAQVRAHGADWGSLSPTQLAQKYQQFLAGGGS